DKSERKATGSYYTPDHIVKYIVEHAVGPVLEEKFEKVRPLLRQAQADRAAFYKQQEGFRKQGMRPKPDAQADLVGREVVDELFDLKVLDPAMGSGHFLVEAADFITNRTLTFLTAFPWNPVRAYLERMRHEILEDVERQNVAINRAQLDEISLLKRYILKRCIYGVDLNPMAVELAKVSLWLDCFTLGAPLSFLDHHLRCGNSLIGATFKELEEATAGQLFAINYEPMYRAIRNVLTVARLADATAAEVRESFTKHTAARKELSGYQVLFNILSARYFGRPEAMTLLEHGRDLDLSDRARLLAGLKKRDRAMIEAVEVAAVERRFFHWELEFPECFFKFRQDTSQQVDRKEPVEAGFDAVIGNPPYDELSEFAAGRELPEKAYFKAIPLYAQALEGRVNVFRLFILRALSVLSDHGRHSFIVPMALLGDSFTAPLRRHLLMVGLLRSVVAFPQKDDPRKRVFLDAKLSTCIYVAAHPGDPTSEIAITTYPWNTFEDEPKRYRTSLRELRSLDPEMLSLAAVNRTDIARWQTVNACNRVASWREVAKCYLGELMTNASNAHLTSVKPVGPRLLRGANINYYVLLGEPKQGEALYLKEKEFLNEYSRDIRATHSRGPRVGFQESCPMDNWRRLIACLVPPGYYCVHKIRYFAPDAKYDLYALLAVFNSAMTDWRFSLTSTNNSVNAYEVDVLPMPRFARLAANNPYAVSVDWRHWSSVLSSRGGEGAGTWRLSVEDEIKRTPRGAAAWPNTIHDGLAAAGKEMSRLGQEWQGLTDDFAGWLVEELGIDEQHFTGMTRLRGGQANFHEMGWGGFSDLLRRNRRACRADPETAHAKIEKQYATVAARVLENREKFAALDAAIDRIVWQLVGLNPDGSLPRAD
ncbi:MAG: N-6 DNA methylase, partial [Chloroflexi bacterium]|nr:N-6 DNA methylase [Chloroflexota bacterium]